MTKQLLKTTLIAGILGSVVFCFFFLIISYISGSNPFLPQYKPLDFFIYVLTIAAATTIYRFQINQGHLHFWEGIPLGLGVSFIILAFSLLFLSIFIQVVPSVKENYAMYEIRQFEENKEKFIQSWNDNKKVLNAEESGEVTYQKTRENYNRRDWKSYLLWQEIYQKLFVGIFISVIVAAVLRK